MTQFIEQFRNNAQTAGATVATVRRKAEAIYDHLSGWISADKPGVLATPDYLDEQLFASLGKIDGLITNPNETELESAYYGVTDAFAGIARTGSICVAVTPGLGGSASLFTRFHIAILDSSDIYYRPSDLLRVEQFRASGFLTNMTFITGPSATADMGELVRGVHGPGGLHILLLE